MIEFVPAHVEAADGSTVRVYLDKTTAETTARKLVGMSVRRVRIEQIFEAAASPTRALSIRPERKPKRFRHSTPATNARRVAGSLPERILARINSKPGHHFKNGDFHDLDEPKRVAAALSRLTQSKRIGKISMGVFCAQRSTAGTSGANGTAHNYGAGHERANAASAMPRVFAVLHEHSGEWMDARQVGKILELSDEKEIAAVRASLNRLYGKKVVDRDFGKYRWHAGLPTMEGLDVAA